MAAAAAAAVGGFDGIFRLKDGGKKVKNASKKPLHHHRSQPFTSGWVPSAPLSHASRLLNVRCAGSSTRTHMPDVVSEKRVGLCLLFTYSNFKESGRVNKLRKSKLKTFPKNVGR